MKIKHKTQPICIPYFWCKDYYQSIQESFLKFPPWGEGSFANHGYGGGGGGEYMGKFIYWYEHI